jgi:hypothetical protein
MLARLDEGVENDIRAFRRLLASSFQIEPHDGRFRGSHTWYAGGAADFCDQTAPSTIRRRRLEEYGSGFGQGPFDLSMVSRRNPGPGPLGSFSMSPRLVSGKTPVV